MNINLMVFPEKYLVGVNGPFWTQNHSVSLKLWIHPKDFKILHIEREHENHI